VTVLIVAFIILNVETNNPRDVADQILTFDEVEEVHVVFGAFDLIIKASFKTPEDLSNFVINTLRKIEGVKDTITNVCAT
jgi:DNA-binding Lrp family transcriptional regulator